MSKDSLERLKRIGNIVLPRCAELGAQILAHHELGAVTLPVVQCNATNGMYNQYQFMSWRYVG